MARQGTVQVEGLGQLRRQLRALGDDLADLKQANAAVSAFIAPAAAARAPRRTGRLAASVRGTRAAGGATVAAGGASVPYAGPVHWGWPSRHIDAQPFIRDTALATESAWLPIYEAELARLTEKVNTAGVGTS